MQDASHEDHQISHRVRNITSDSYSLNELGQSEANAKTSAPTSLKSLALLLLAFRNAAAAFFPNPLRPVVGQHHKAGMYDSNGVRPGLHSTFWMRQNDDSIRENLQTEDISRLIPWLKRGRKRVTSRTIQPALQRIVRPVDRVAPAVWMDEYLEDEFMRSTRWDAAALGRAAFEEGAGSDTTLTYGEFDRGDFIQLLHRAISVSQRDTHELTFADVGSGGGRLVLHAAARWEWERCIGVEILEPLHDIACQSYRRACQMSQAIGTPLSPCTFQHLDMASVQDAHSALSHVDVAFVFSTCFSGAAVASTLRRVLRAGALVISIDTLRPNSEGIANTEATTDEASWPFLVLVDTLAVGSDARPHTAYIWRLQRESPVPSFDIPVPNPSLDEESS